MQRVAALVFFGAAVAFATWMLVPVWSVTPGAMPQNLASNWPEVSALNTELARFDSRPAVRPALPAGERNPFTFSSAPGVTRPTAPAPIAPAPPPPPAAPTLPKLIAISSKTTSAGIVRTAALSFGDAVLLAHPGDTVGALVVHSIDNGTVELVDPSTGAAYRVR